MDPQQPMRLTHQDDDFGSVWQGLWATRVDPALGHCFVRNSAAAVDEEGLNTAGPTQQTYGFLQLAFQHFNEELFDGALPEALITLQRKPGARAYFSPSRFESRHPQGPAVQLTHEIALNPMYLRERSDEEVASTLVHEMVHLWQQAFGQVSRGGYHNREWADKMLSLGLCPSDTGHPGGKQTGPRMTHYILRAGRFVDSFRALLEKGFAIRWQDRRSGGAGSQRGNDRIKWTCPSCAQNAWAKPSASLVCGECGLRMTPVSAEHQCAGTARLGFARKAG